MTTNIYIFQAIMQMINPITLLICIWSCLCAFILKILLGFLLPE